MESKLEICKCPSCLINLITNEDGTVTHGTFVASRTRRSHWAKHQAKQDEEVTSTISSLHKLSIQKSPQSQSVSVKHETDLSDDEDPKDTIELSFILCFMAWLHLVCGISHQRCRQALVYLTYMIKNHHQLVPQQGLEISIPKDIRTITKHLDLDPKLEELICCCKCYSTYDIETAPFECNYQLTEDSDICGEDLFSVHLIPSLDGIPRALEHPPKRTRPQIPHPTNPASLFIMQPFLDWLTWFLRLPEVESSMEQWSKQLSSVPNDQVADVQQSRAWKKMFKKENLSLKTPPPLDLGFSLFIDWYNPLGNKISGKQRSMGVMSLTCFNLPPSIRYKPRFTFLAGVIPAPNQPDMVTISNVLRPLVDTLLELNDGKIISTPAYPNGRKVKVRLFGLIGDMVATHKVGGFASHSARYFCSWCKTRDSEIADFTIGPLRKRLETLTRAQQWKDLSTATAKANLVKKTGVRWSELHRLPYWDPVMNISLGVMHNWFEGVLQHHFRYRWGFNGNKKGTNEATAISSEDENENEDIADIVNDDFWSEGKKKCFLKSILEVVVPTGVTRMPNGLGTAKNGKLKASEWHSLFANHVPLACIDLFFDNEDLDQCESQSHFDNLCALVQCTNAVGSRQVEKSTISQFKNSYQMYLESSKVIFPNLKALPNHHYALHIPHQMEWWGPLMQMAEFAGERLIGILQKYKTNSQKHTNRTIMKKFCQLQRLTAHQEMDIATEDKENIQSGKRFIIENQAYIRILSLCQKKNPALRSCLDWSGDASNGVLSNCARSVGWVTVSSGKRVSSKKPNDVITFLFEGKIRYGRVSEIIKLESGWDSEIIKAMEYDVVKTNTAIDRYLEELEVVRVAFHGKSIYLLSEHLIDPLASRSLPAWTLGSDQPTILVRTVTRSMVVVDDSDNSLDEMMMDIDVDP